MRLFAKRNCHICRGKGWVREAHGEILDCECIFMDTRFTEEEIDDALANGTIEVIPASDDPILDLMESAISSAAPNPANGSGVEAQEDSMTDCKCCGYPLILKSDFSPEEIAENEGMFEDNNEGLCGSCHMYPKGTNKFKDSNNG